MFLTVLFIANSASAQSIIDETTFQNRLHYKVKLYNATILIDKHSGGISGMLDKEGNDWINWKRLNEEKYPDSAAGNYRGMPNLVFGGKDNGVGHPGFDNTLSFIREENRINVRSLNGKWEFQYIFHPKYIELQVLSTPKNERNYWFLYEGIPGGEFNPDKNYWGTNKGINPAKPDYLNGEEEYGFWNWVFVGHQNNKQTLFIAQKKEDEIKDTFGYLGNSDKGLNAENGMVVFGFGRDKNAKPLLNRNNTFYIGFYDKNVTEENFSKFRKFMQKNFY